MEKLEGLKKQLSELAVLLNAFKSEAVQLRILDFVLGEDATEASDDKVDKPRHVRKRRPQRTKTPKKVSSGAVTAKKKVASGTGAKATLTQLLAGAFFDKPRTINDIIEHCKHNLALSFRANEFSTKLGRLVRNGDLTRKKNADNQYEYTKP